MAGVGVGLGWGTKSSLFVIGGDEGLARRTDRLFPSAMIQFIAGERGDGRACQPLGGGGSSSSWALPAAANAAAGIIVHHQWDDSTGGKG